MRITNYLLKYLLDENTTLLLNTISGAIDLVDATTASLIVPGDSIDPQSTKLPYKDLLNRGYIFESKKDEMELVARYTSIQQTGAQASAVRNYTICPTMGCNLRCTYCFEQDDMHRLHDKMTKEQIDSIFSLIEHDLQEVSHTSTAPQFSVSLYGGEPLLPENYDLVSYILSMAHEHCLQVRIITNGISIQQFLSLLQQYDNIAVQVTLDGDKSTHDKRRISAAGKGTFDRIVENVNLLAHAHIQTHLRINIDQDNVDGLSSLISFIRASEWMDDDYIVPYVAPVFKYRKGVDDSMSEGDLLAQILAVEPHLGSSDAAIKHISAPCINYVQNLFTFTQTVKPWKTSYCEAASGCNLVFTPNGSVTTCLMLAGRNSHQIGSFDQTGVHINQIALDKWTKRNVLSLEKCRFCKYALFCGGGCPVAAIDVNGGIDCPLCSDIEKVLRVFVASISPRLLGQCA